MTFLGVDVSHYQLPPLPWPAWVAAGLRVAVVKLTDGLTVDPAAVRHLADARAAGVACIGAYHWIKPGSGAAQAGKFIAALTPECQFAVLDVEEPGVTAADVLAWCAAFGDRLPLLLYGGANLLGPMLAAHPELLRYSIWWADYGPFAPGTKAPPLRTPDQLAEVVPHPPAGAHMVGHQAAGDNGRFPPYAGAVDLTLWREWPDGRRNTMALPSVMVPRGSLVGIHAINPGNTLALVKQAVADGAPYAGVKMLNDAAALAQVKQASPTTWTYLRYYNPEDDSLQGLDDWSVQNEIDWCTRVLNKIYSQITTDQYKYVDWACAWNEEDPPGQWGYQKLGETFLRLGQMNEARRAPGQAYVKLGFGCLAQGTPELWEIDELIGTGLFAWMQAHDYIWDVHEGAFAWQTIDEGYQSNMPSTPAIAALGPGHGDVKAWPGSGSGSFRFVWTFERRLRPLGQLVKLWAGEWYPGVLGDLARYWWYDDRLCVYEYAICYSVYNLGHTTDWPDVTGDFTNPAFRQHRIDIRGRINGGLMPYTFTDDEFAALVASNQADAAILAKHQPAPAKHLPGTTNQSAVNLFHNVFGGYVELTAAIPNWATTMAASTAQRNAPYTGPAIEDLPGLSAAQKAALIKYL